MRNRALDFASPSGRNSGRLVFFVGLVLLGLAAWNYRHQAPALRDIEATLNARQLSQVKTAKQPEQDETAMASARRQLALNWEPLFTAVESAATPKVALLSLEPDASRGTVRLALEAKDNAAMLAYVEGLSRQPGMRSVTLASQETQLEHPQQPIRFTVEASWQ